MEFIKNHKIGVIVTCASVALLALVIILSSMFIMDSKDKLTCSVEFTMEGPEGENVQFAGFTRDDGNISLTFTGNTQLFGGARGSAQGTIEEMGSAAGGRLIKMADPYYDRTVYLRAAHYTTYVIVPEESGTAFGVWAVAVTDDEKSEPTILFWMDLRPDGTVILDRTDAIDPNAEWAGEVGSAWAEELSWTEHEGTYEFADPAGRSFTFRATFA